MGNAEPPIWTLAQHFAAGSTAIGQIVSQRLAAPEPVCHHFCEIDAVDPMKVSVEATYCQFVPLFVSAGVNFLPDRLEAWETVKPSDEWLQRRIPLILEAAEKARLIYEGWTWEPRNRQPVGATDIQVINNRTV